MIWIFSAKQLRQQKSVPFACEVILVPFEKTKYVSQNFEDGQVLHADDLIDMEQGIKDAQDELEKIVSISQTEIANICV